MSDDVSYYEAVGTSAGLGDGTESLNTIPNLIFNNPNTAFLKPKRGWCKQKCEFPISRCLFLSVLRNWAANTLQAVNTLRTWPNTLHLLHLPSSFCYLIVTYCCWSGSYLFANGQNFKKRKWAFDLWERMRGEYDEIGKMSVKKRI